MNGREERLANPKYAAYIARLVAETPPLTDAQVEHLRRLLPASRKAGAVRTDLGPGEADR